MKLREVTEFVIESQKSIEEFLREVDADLFIYAVELRSNGSMKLLRDGIWNRCFADT